MHSLEADVGTHRCTRWTYFALRMHSSWKRITGNRGARGRWRYLRILRHLLRPTYLHFTDAPVDADVLALTDALEELGGTCIFTDALVKADVFALPTR